jgi:hypothetical protein
MLSGWRKHSKLFSVILDEPRKWASAAGNAFIKNLRLSDFKRAWRKFLTMFFRGNGNFASLLQQNGAPEYNSRRGNDWCAFPGL